MTWFRKKPVSVEAWQLPPAGPQSDPVPIPGWLMRAVLDGTVRVLGGEDPYAEIDTLEGTMRADVGDWIIKGVKGELYPCKPDIFEETYEVLPEVQEASVDASAGRVDAAGIPSVLAELADGVGGTITDVQLLPDGSGFATMSMPLLKDHWLYTKGPDGYSLPPPMPFRMPGGTPERRALEAKVREAAKYAVRGATMHGADMDFDPDALLQNLIVGLFGYHTPDGLAKVEVEYAKAIGAEAIGTEFLTAEPADDDEGEPETARTLRMIGGKPQADHPWRKQIKREVKGRSE